MGLYKVLKYQREDCHFSQVHWVTIETSKLPRRNYNYGFWNIQISNEWESESYDMLSLCECTNKRTKHGELVFDGDIIKGFLSSEELGEGYGVEVIVDIKQGMPKILDDERYEWTVDDNIYNYSLANNGTLNNWDKQHGIIIDDYNWIPGPYDTPVEEKDKYRYIFGLTQRVKSRMEQFYNARHEDYYSYGGMYIVSWSDETRDYILKREFEEQ